MKIKFGVTNFQQHQQRNLYNELYENNNYPRNPNQKNGRPKLKVC